MGSGPISNFHVSFPFQLRRTGNPSDYTQVLPMEWTDSSKCFGSAIIVNHISWSRITLSAVTNWQSQGQNGEDMFGFCCPWSKQQAWAQFLARSIFYIPHHWLELLSPFGRTSVLIFCHVRVSGDLCNQGSEKHQSEMDCKLAASMHIYSPGYGWRQGAGLMLRRKPVCRR